MTQTENKSVRDAEAAENANHIPTFDEVYAMPYVRESIESVLDQNVRQYKLLSGYKDDLRQEILIHLNSQLPHFNPEKSSIQTFARVAILTGLRMARRRHYTRDNITLRNSLDVMTFEDHDDDNTYLQEEDCRAYAAHAKNNVDAAMLARDVNTLLSDCPTELRKVAILLKQGYSTWQIADLMEIAQSTLRYKYIHKLRKVFQKDFSKKSRNPSLI